MQGRTVVRGVPSLHSVNYEAMIGRTSPWLSVVVGAGCAFQEAESVIEQFQPTKRGWVTPP